MLVRIYFIELFITLYRKLGWSLHDDMGVKCQLPVELLDLVNLDAVLCSKHIQTFGVRLELWISS